jgi:hypothetical protein
MKCFLFCYIVNNKSANSFAIMTGNRRYSTQLLLLDIALAQLNNVIDTSIPDLCFDSFMIWELDNSCAELYPYSWSDVLAISRLGMAETLNEVCLANTRVTCKYYFVMGRVPLNSKW